MNEMRQVYFDDLIVGYIYCVRCSGVKTYHRITAKSEDEASMQTIMRDRTSHLQVPRSETFSREQWATFRWDEECYGTMYEDIPDEHGVP